MRPILIIYATGLGIIYNILYTPTTRRKCSTKSARCRYVTWPYTRSATRRLSGSKRDISAFLPGWILYDWKSLSDWHRRLVWRARTRQRHWRWWGLSLSWTLARISTSSVTRWALVYFSPSVSVRQCLYVSVCQCLYVSVCLLLSLTASSYLCLPLAVSICL